MSDDGAGSAFAEQDNEQLVVRPRRRLRNTGEASVGAAAGWIVISFLFSLRFHGSARVLVVGAGVALAVGVIGLINLSYRRTKLSLINRRLIFTGLLRDRVALAGDDSGRVVKVEVDWGKASARRSRFWLLINAAGRTAVCLNRDAWDEGQLEGLREHLGLPIEIVETPKRPVELRKAHPGTIPWWGAHVTVATVLAMLVLAALVLALQRLAA
jgi:hypothetical protein